jgi:MFS family permease
MSQRYGRRKVVMAAAVVFGLGALAAAAAQDTESLAVARFVLGLAVGGASNMVPVYIAGVAGAVLVDKAGRRRTMLWFLPASGLAMAILAAAFLLGSSTAQRWTMVLALFAYILANGIGMQAIVWLIGPEILPLSVRGPATSLATTTVWGFDLIISMTALTMVRSMGLSGTFLVYAVMNVLCIVFVLRKVPETRGRTLEQIEQDLRRPGSHKA